MPSPNENGSPQSALDAINEALGVTDAVEDEEELESGDEDSDGDSDADGESDADDNEGDDGEAGDDAGDEDPDGEEGDEEGEQGEPTAAAKAAAKAAGKPVSEFNPDGTPKKAEAKKLDPVNDPIPKDLKRETSDRMRALIKNVKEVTTERDQVRGDFDTIINGIKASGSSPEQYGEAISWLSLFNSPKADDRRKAYELVEDVADRMATLLGIDRALADPLKGHADLITAVQNKTATMQMAKEVARTRNAAKFTGDINLGQQQRQQTEEQARQEHEQAKTDLNAFDTEMRGKDPLYDLKRKQIVPILQPLFKQIPKAQWAQAYKDAYARARVQPKGRLNGDKQISKSQPLRGGKNPAGGQSRAPTSALEAMNAGIARAK